jgi:GNAT superfamily N-acetyltransferase
MPQLHHVRLTAADTDRIAARAELVVRQRAHDVPYDPPASRLDSLRILSHPFPAADVEYWVSYEGDVLVGTAMLELPTSDNPDNAAVEILVDPAHRRRGVGRAIAEHALARVRDLGRRRVVAEVLESRPGHDGDTEGVAFARAMGAEQALVEVRRRLDFTRVPAGRTEQLLAESAAASPDYHLVPWRDRAPDQVLDGVATLEGRMVTDAPMGTLEWEPERYDAKRWRELEDTFVGRERRVYGCAAVHTASGEVAGYTMVGLDGDVPEHAWQSTTIVHPDHRGHRLGLRLKADTHVRLVAAEPELRTIDTWNAGENAPMIAVNELMGYRPLDAWAEWQLRLGRRLVAASAYFPVAAPFGVVRPPRWTAASYDPRLSPTTQPL